MSTQKEIDEVIRVCMEQGAQAAIVILKSGTDFGADILMYMRERAGLEPFARARLEQGWAKYLEMFAEDGGAFGLLLCPGFRQKGPIIAAGRADEAGDIVKALSARAYQITKVRMAAIRYEIAFQPAILAAMAEMMGPQGQA